MVVFHLTGPAERLRRYGHGRSTFRGNLPTCMNHLMTLTVHKELTDMLDLAACANDFVLGNEHRLSVFGRFH